MTDECSHENTEIMDVEGEEVCLDCGLILMTSLNSAHERLMDIYSKICGVSSYDPNTHWKEKLFHLLCMDSEIPHHDLRIIKETYRSRYKKKKAGKGRIRKTLSIIRKNRVIPNADRYVEKWYQIRHYINETKPEKIDSETYEFYFFCFPKMLNAFLAVRPPGRKSMIAYVFLMLMVFLRCGRADLARYCLLPKSPQVRANIFAIWENMRKHMEWPNIQIPDAKFFKNHK